MENASKALIMAGGILIAIIILSLFIYMLTTTSRMAKAQDEKVAAQQLAAFNKEYEAYNKKRMYGTDVITVYNKAEDNNNKYIDNKAYWVTVKVYNSDIEISVQNQKEFKNSIFKCINIGYSNNTGRINLIEFEQI